MLAVENKCLSEFPAEAEAFPDTAEFTETYKVTGRLAGNVRLASGNSQYRLEVYDANLPLKPFPTRGGLN